MSIREPIQNEYGRPGDMPPVADVGPSGWVMFASIVLIVAGVMRVFDSIWAFRHNGALPDNFEAALFGHNLETYGWIYLVTAVILIGAGFAVLAGSEVGRWIGVFAGAVAAVVAIWWIPFYPVWSLVYIAAGILVIYALVTHGGEQELR